MEKADKGIRRKLQFPVPRSPTVSPPTTGDESDNSVESSESSESTCSSNSSTGSIDSNTGFEYQAKVCGKYSLFC